MWDFATDPQTGDWLFAANRDLMGVDAEALDRQRIMNRLKISRGSFAYDITGLLGSRLYAAERFSEARGEVEIPLLIREALEPMDDIEVRDVRVTPDALEPGKMIVELKYGHTAGVEAVVPTADEQEEFFVTLVL